MTRKGDIVAGAMFLFPFLAFLLLFQYLPIAMLARDSVHAFTLFNPADKTFVGIDNYVRLFTDPTVRQSFFVTMVFAVALVSLVIPLALALAVFLNSRLPARDVVRTIVLLPTVTSAVVVATMWTFILHPANGLLNAVLGSVGLGPFDFLTSRAEALPSLVLMMLWQQVGFAAVIFLSGLQNIPEDLIDAARVDGANAFERILFVVLPLLGRTTLVVVVIMTVFSLQTFAPAWLMTGGGPLGSTNFLVHHIYVTSFQFQQPGFASAICVGLIAIALAVSGLQMIALRSRWSY